MKDDVQHPNSAQIRTTNILNRRVFLGSILGAGFPSFGWSADLSPHIRKYTQNEIIVIKAVNAFNQNRPLDYKRYVSSSVVAYTVRQGKPIFNALPYLLQLMAQGNKFNLDCNSLSSNGVTVTGDACWVDYDPGIPPSIDTLGFDFKVSGNMIVSMHSRTNVENSCSLSTEKCL